MNEHEEQQETEELEVLEDDSPEQTVEQLADIIADEYIL